MATKTFSRIIVVALSISLHAYSQNILLPDAIMINEQVQIIEEDYPDKYNNSLLTKNLQDEDLLKSGTLNQVIVDFMLQNPQKCFDPAPLLQESFYPLTPEKFNSPADVSCLSDSSKAKVVIRYNDVKSLLFTEEWAVDQKTFNFSKKVTGVLPVRHFHKEIPDGPGTFTDTTTLISLLAYFPLTKKTETELAEARKRLVPVKRITYEFLLCDLHFLIWDNTLDDSYLMTRDPEDKQIYSAYLPDKAPVYLELSPTWGVYQLHQIRDLINQKVFVENMPVISPEDETPLTKEGLAEGFGLSLDSLGEFILRDKTVVYDDNGTKMEYENKANTRELCGNIYSLLFGEEWFIDPQTLYMEKKVISLTPVFWDRKMDPDGLWSWEKRRVFKILMP